MRFFIICGFFGVCFSIQAQRTVCNFDIRFTKLFWENQTVTIQWSIKPQPAKGVLKIYRKGTDSITEDSVITINDLNKKEFSDSHKSLNKLKRYEYRLELLANNNTCEVRKITLGRVIEEEDTLSLNTGKKLSAFTTKEVYDISPKQLSVKAGSYIKVNLKIKDLTFPFKTNLQYCLIFNDTVYRTISTIEDDDYTQAKIFIFEKPSHIQQFRIALVQDNVILGITQKIDFE